MFLGPRPFIILALARTGTKMLVGATRSHPDIPDVTHEFKGDREQYWKHPYVLSNTLEPWMLKRRRWWSIGRRPRLIALTREDAVAGARSLMMMSYHFPEGVTVLPPHEVIKLAWWRQAQERKFQAVAHLAVTYESLCDGEQITYFPLWFCANLCDLLRIPRNLLTTSVPKRPQTRLKNEDEIAWLRV